MQHSKRQQFRSQFKPHNTLVLRWTESIHSNICFLSALIAFFLTIFFLVYYLVSMHLFSCCLGRNLVGSIEMNFWFFFSLLHNLSIGIFFCCIIFHNLIGNTENVKNNGKKENEKNCTLLMQMCIELMADLFMIFIVAELEATNSKMEIQIHLSTLRARIVVTSIVNDCCFFLHFSLILRKAMRTSVKI